MASISALPAATNAARRPRAPTANHAILRRPCRTAASTPTRSRVRFQRAADAKCGAVGGGSDYIRHHLRALTRSGFLGGYSALPPHRRRQNDVTLPTEAGRGSWLGRAVTASAAGDGRTGRPRIALTAGYAENADQSPLPVAPRLRRPFVAACRGLFDDGIRPGAPGRCPRRGTAAARRRPARSAPASRRSSPRSIAARAAIRRAPSRCAATRSGRPPAGRTRPRRPRRPRQGCEGHRLLLCSVAVAAMRRSSTQISRMRGNLDRINIDLDACAAAAGGADRENSAAR